MMESTKKHGQNEDSETCVLQIGHRFLRNGVQQEFQSKISKTSF